MNNRIGLIAGGAVAILAAAGIWNCTSNGQLKLWAEGVHAIDFRNGPVEVFSTACADPQLTTAGVTSEKSIKAIMRFMPVSRRFSPKSCTDLILGR